MGFCSKKLKKRVKGKLHGAVKGDKKRFKIRNYNCITSIFHFSDNEGIKYLKFITCNGLTFVLGEIDIDQFEVSNNLKQIEINPDCFIYGVETYSFEGRIRKVVLTFYLEY